MRAQADTKVVTFYSIFVSSDFRHGYSSVFNGYGFFPPDVTKNAWNYERGRLLAVIIKARGLGELPLMPPKRAGVKGKRPASEYRALPAYKTFVAAFAMGDII